MTDNDFTTIIQPLLDAFPSFASYYTTHRATLRPAMMTQLSSVDANDARDVISKLVSGDMAMPPNYEFDRVGVMIKRESNDIRSKRNERCRVVDKYLNHKSGAMAYVRSSRTGHIAIELGAMVKRKEITHEQNDAMMVEVMAWDKGGPQPLWCAELFGSKQQPEVTK